MALPEIEPAFWKLVETDDPATNKILKAWAPWYVKKTGAAYKDGDEVRAQLKALGYDPSAEIVMGHDEVVDLSRKTAAKADVAAAASAFLLSASPDPARARYQSPLRAISIIRNTPKHASTGKTSCDICGTPKKSEWSPINAAVRTKRGYTGEDWELLDNAMVTRWFAKTSAPKPKSADVAKFREVIKVFSDAPENATGVKVATALKKEFGGHIDPWRYFVETLGFCGVLKTPFMPGNLQAWTNAQGRRGGPGRSEAPSPSCYWRRKQGFDREVFETLFPEIKLPTSLHAPEG